MKNHLYHIASKDAMPRVSGLASRLMPRVSCLASISRFALPRVSMPETLRRANLHSGIKIEIQ